MTSAKSIEHFKRIVVPVVTEKTALIGRAGQCVAFQVAPKATKLEIKEAVEALYSVRVTKVNTVNSLGKPKRSSRGVSYRSNTRKAYVTLAEGQTISVVEGV